MGKGVGVSETTRDVRGMVDCGKVEVDEEKFPD
jgi:hypothetical protein